MNQPLKLKPEDLYPAVEIESKRNRFVRAIADYKRHFGYGAGENVRLFSVPGRTEISGNHTDHNCGKVLAASISLDIIAVAEPIKENKIVIKSEGFEKSSVGLSDLDAAPEERGTSEALIRGVAAGFEKAGFKIGGFIAYTTSEVLPGSGMSSSAAFEVMVGIILSNLYNDGKIDANRIAKIAQKAENEYFGKPCGLLDQTACASGGFIVIDFKDAASPIINKVTSADWGSFGHDLCIINTGGSHCQMTDAYAAIPCEMREIASYFGVDCLRQIARKDIELNTNILRELYGDRALLRALHFFEENSRVEKLIHALANSDFDSFLKYINDSGGSSFKYLQNIYQAGETKYQPIAVALNAAEYALGGKGACRVHGGGFAGTVQAFVPHEMLKIFKFNLERIFGTGSCYVLSVREHGCTEVVLD
ncbi:MAG: galactokinase [Oscillospiraceae bacterium]|jgi:galactokinase|nr:galactokinase [Oscillospiraceae bacterium]